MTTTLTPYDNLPPQLTTLTENERFHHRHHHPAYYHDYKSRVTISKAFQNNNNKITKDDASLLQKSTTTTLQKLHKSHSYSETLQTKAAATINNQQEQQQQQNINFELEVEGSGLPATSLHAESDNEVRFGRREATATTTAAAGTRALIIQKDIQTANDFYCLNNNNNYNHNNNKHKNYVNFVNFDYSDDDSDVVFVNTKTAIDDLNAVGVSGGVRDGSTAAVGDDDDVGLNIIINDGIIIDEQDDEDACLILPADSHSSSRRRLKARSSSTGSSSSSSPCLRLHAFITRNWYLNYLIPLTILLALMLFAYLTRDYAKRLLYWIETQNPWIIFGIFIILFIIVSFPIVVGYFVLMITSGYLFGFFKGLPTVILGANFGIALAHLCIRSMRHRIPMHRLIKNETGRAILRVISGPRAFRVVLFTRLTPIPFGLQNAIFGVSSINPRIYHAATFLGLLPAQTINVYLGSTLRSMHEVLNSHGTAVTGYISFAIEVICGVALMFWVVQKARKELSETLLDCSSTENKIINIQV